MEAWDFFISLKGGGAKKGFALLKAEMIKVRREKIEGILKDIDDIANLEFPEWIPIEKR